LKFAEHDDLPYGLATIGPAGRPPAIGGEDGSPRHDVLKSESENFDSVAAAFHRGWADRPHRDAALAELLGRV
jgi:hypothetical protein